MSETLSTHDIEVHDPGSIRKDEPGTIAYRDSRGNIKKINPMLSLDVNLENTLGPEYLKKLGGTLWEGVWKTAATFIPVGKTWKIAVALTGAKIATKSVGTAGNYIITGEYKTGKAIKKALIVNAFTPTNYAPIANAAFAKNTVVGKTFGSYYKALAGDGHSTSILQKNRLDYVSINHIAGKHVHLHGNIYPLNPFLQAESKVFGYGAYNVISGKNPFEVAHANQIHSNDTQHKETVKNTEQQGGGHDVHQKTPVHQAEPKSGGHHDEGPYQGAFMPFTVELTQALSNKIKSGYQEGVEIEAGINFQTAIWQDKVNKAKGVVDKTIEYVKGVPTELANTAMRDVVLFNRYVSIPIFNVLASGVAETAEAIDKSAVGIADYALAVGNIQYAKFAQAVDDFQQHFNIGSKNPYDEAVQFKEFRGNKNITYTTKVKQDNAQIKKPMPVKLLKDVKKEQQELNNKFGPMMGRLQAYNTERMTGIKAGTMGNALPGQPFANNTPQMRNSVFNNYNSNRTTISQTRK